MRSGRCTEGGVCLPHQLSEGKNSQKFNHILQIRPQKVQGVEVESATAPTI